MIADDEIHVLRLIKRFVNTGNTAVVGEAQNGIDAYDITLQLKPDILITDIRMPGYDGIEMIKRLKTQVPDLSIIIISGYRDFEYAQEAIRYGVMDYLLKPIRESDLRSALDKSINKLKKERDEKENAENIKETLIEKSKMLESRSLSSFLFDGMNASENIDKYFPKFLLENNRLFFVIILKIDNLDNERSFENNRREVTENLEKKVISILDKTDNKHISFYKNNRMYIVCSSPVSARQTPLPEKSLSSLSSLLKSESYKYIFLKFTAGIGPMVSSPTDIKSSLDKAEHFLHSRVFLSKEYIFGPWNCAPTKQACENQYAKHLHELRAAVETTNTNKAVSILDAIADSFVSASIEPHEIYKLSENIIEETASAIIRIESSSNYENTSSQALNCVDNLDDINSILSITKEFVLSGIGFLLDIQEQRVSRPVRLAKEYIMQNYDRQVTLDEVAEKVFINPNYLSSLFKQKTGIGFSEYVSSVKVEKAKELLQSSFMNINEIAYAVGYTDVKRFSKMFIKNVGIRPSEYRKFYS